MELLFVVKDWMTVQHDHRAEVYAAYPANSFTKHKFRKCHQTSNTLLVGPFIIWYFRVSTNVFSKRKEGKKERKLTF